MPAVVPFIAAAGEAYAATAATGLVAGLYAAGAVATLAGAVSHNRNLSMLGGVLGLAGGGASALGLGSDASSAASSAADVARTSDATAATADAATPSAVSAGTASNATDLGSLSGGTASDLTNGAAAASSLAPSTADGLAAGSSGTAGDLAAGSAGAPGNVAATDVSMPGLISSNSGLGAPVQFGGPGSFGSPGGLTGAGASPLTTPPGDGVGWWDSAKQAIGNFSDWMRQNPAATKVGGGLIYGAMNYYGNQQLADANMQRQKNYQDWVRQRYSDSVRNLQVPTPYMTAGLSSGIISGNQG
jgi:hypothetical protein